MVPPPSKSIFMTLIIDNPTVEQVLQPSEMIKALELAARELANGGAVNAPPYRDFTPRDGKDYGPKFPADGNPTHHMFTSLTGAIAKLDVTADRIDSDIVTYIERDGAVLQRRFPGTPDRKFVAWFSSTAREQANCSPSSMTAISRNSVSQGLAR